MYRKNEIDFTDKEIKELVEYYTYFSTPKERIQLDRIIDKKFDISEWDGQFIRGLLKRHKVLMVSQQRKTDLALENYKNSRRVKDLIQDNSKFI